MDSSSESVTSPLMSKQSTGNEVRKDQVYSYDPSMEIMGHESQSSDSSIRGTPPPPKNSPPPPPPPPPPPAEEEVVEQEYGCKYCVKKFSNKQALGGHQNAHKVERTMERTLKEGRSTNFGYLSAGGPSYYPGMNYSSHYNFPTFFNRSPEFFNQATYLSRQAAAGGSMQHALMIYAPAPATNEAYSRNYIQFIPKNDPPVSIGYSAPPLALPAPDPSYMNFQGGNNNQQMIINPQLMNQPLVDESGLDLSLRLSTV